MFNSCGLLFDILQVLKFCRIVLCHLKIERQLDRATPLNVRRLERGRNRTNDVLANRFSQATPRSLVGSWGLRLNARYCSFALPQLLAEFSREAALKIGHGPLLDQPRP